MIDRYINKQEFTLYDVHLPAWEVVLNSSPADYHYREEQKGKKVYTRFAGFKSTAIYAIMRMINTKKRKTTLQQIRLIEYGALGYERL